MNNIHYMNWMEAINKHVTATPLEQSLLDIIIKYENMRYWIEMAKDVVRTQGFPEYQFKYFALSSAIPCQTKRFRLMCMARMEMHGIAFDTDKYSRYLNEGVM